MKCRTDINASQREDVPRDGMSTQDIEEIQKIQSVDIDYHTNFYRCNSVNKILR